ncbi:TapB family protein [Cochleicola gelatinilyticus]|uniref:DUF3108 domain-containing protein n=1 Tax=Cochleicola gelatinilyticus TaxID=1763537 RepID=A0A167IHZ4_9FLAO|nr:hypothetical protein [Cochleicola gelatinilyticus]OAB79671.1 hypothetical protein ULVI_02675 [Cochleicola gelatinilyticus]
MKTKLLFTFILTFCSALSFGQSQCSDYYPFSEGTTSQITTYDRRGRTAAIVDYTVTQVSNTGGSEVAAMQSVVKDEDGETIAETTFDIICSGETVAIDSKSLISPQLFEQYQSMEYEVSGTNIEFPNNLQVGQTLPDADMQMRINMAGINMNMNVGITDRRVTNLESVTTPAGTFNCFVIEYTMDMRMGMSRTGTSKQWIAEGVGMVKQEDYNRSGRVTSSSLLTAFSN